MEPALLLEFPGPDAGKDCAEFEHADSATASAAIEANRE
jgi:hypothetical protein